MFLPHIQTAERPPVSSPVPVIISRREHPRLDRGCCLDVLSGDSWFPYSFHNNVPEAIQAFHALPHHVLWGDVQKRWRVLCHRLDLGEFATIAQEQPAPDWQQ